jgi:hypothetical protein
MCIPTLANNFAQHNVLDRVKLKSAQLEKVKQHGLQQSTSNSAADNIFKILGDAGKSQHCDVNVSEFLTLFKQILHERNEHALLCSQRRNGQTSEKFNVIINRARFLKLQLHDQILSSLLTDEPFSIYYYVFI